jgi:integrase
MKVSALIDAYLANLKTRVRQKSVAAKYAFNAESYLLKFAAFLPDREVEGLQQIDLRRWLDANTKTWKSLATQKNAVSFVLNAFHWACDEEEGGLIKASPFRMPKSLRGVSVEPRRPALEEEYRLLFKFASKQLKQILFFLWRTGARTCEARAVKRQNVILGQTPHVRLDVHKTVKKTRKPRIIPLDADTVRLLNYLIRTGHSDFLFVNQTGGPWSDNTLAVNIRRTAIKAGLNGDASVKRISGYCLRHSFACAQVENGLTTKQIADVLGNSPEMVQKVYASSTNQNLAYLHRTITEMNDRRKA